MPVLRLAIAAVVALGPVVGALPVEAASSAQVAASVDRPASAPAASSVRVKIYANCTALHRDYPHGVGRRGARDKVRGKTKPVTTFAVNDVVYRANARQRDADRDGIACEKH